MIILKLLKTENILIFYNLIQITRALTNLSASWKCLGQMKITMSKQKKDCVVQVEIKTTIHQRIT